MPTLNTSDLTQTTDFFGLILSTWFMFYLLARGHSNPITLRMAMVLFALAVYYLNSFFFSLIDPGVSITISSIAVLVALGSIHNLTYQLLPAHLHARLRLVSYAVLLFVLLACIFLLSTPPAAIPTSDSRNFLPIGTPNIWIDFIDFFTAVAIIFNIWQILKQRSELLNLTFYASLIFGVSTIGLAALTVLFHWEIPRYVSTFTILVAFISFGYSIARYQSLLDSRLSIRDFPISALFTFLIAIIYALIARSLQLPVSFTALLVILAVASHSAYDVVRSILNRSFSRQESHLRKELRSLARSPQPISLNAALRRGLAILCHNLDALSGFVALREGPIFRIRASYHSLPVGDIIDITTFPEDELFQPGDRSNYAWMRWAFAADRSIALIAVGHRSGMRQYTEPDLDWLDDVADHIGSLVHTHNLALQAGSPLPGGSPAPETEMNKLLSTLALKPGKHLLKNVEDAFRNLNDFSKLGDSPLVAMLAAEGDTHIARGKSVQQKLLQNLETLRPQESEPPDPIPRHWFGYLILHDAYVRDIPDREIMARLYISEGTFYRTRRKALRGLTRAIIETAAQE